MRKERARRRKRGPKMLIGKGRNVAYKSMRLRKWKDEGTKEKKCHKYRKKKKGGAVNVIYRRKKMKEKNRRRDKRRDRRREEEERKERGRREEGGTIIPVVGPHGWYVEDPADKRGTGDVDRHLERKKVKEGERR
jgi:hypothetical protein